MRLRPSVVLVALCAAALGAVAAAWRSRVASTRRARDALPARLEGSVSGAASEAGAVAGRAERAAPPPPSPTSPRASADRRAVAGDTPPRGAAFLGAPDEPVLRDLRESEVVRVEPGRGGRSLGFVLTLASGRRAYFKPEQSFSGARWYAEVAAYHLDRVLGLGRVPPVVARELPWKLLRAAARRHPRGDEVVVHSGGRVWGALIAWVEGPLVPLRLPPGWEQWLRVGRAPFLSPFRRPSTWLRAVRSWRQNGRIEGPLGGDRWPQVRPDRPERPAELSDMILFDFLARNVDRWSEDLTNVRTRGPGGPLVFLDQGAAFGGGRASNGHLEAQLRAVQRVRRATAEAIERFDLQAFRARLRSEPIQPVLDAARLEGLRVRRQAVLEHLRALRERFGPQRIYFEEASR